MTLDLLREHAASYRAVAYVDLAELRVSVTVASRALVARDRSGKRWSLPLDAAEVAAAQRALDTLDGQLATSARRNWTRSARLVAAVSIVGLLGLADFGWAWIPMIITLFVPCAWSLAALGSLILGRSVLVIAGLMAGHIGEHSWVFATLSAACGVWACSLAWRWATSDEPPRARRMKLAALAAASGVALVSVQGFIARPMRLAWSTATPTEMGVVSLNDLGYGVSISPNGSLAAINTPDSTGKGASLYQARHDLTAWTYVIAGHGGIVRSTNAYALAFADDENLLTVRAAVSSDDSMVVSLERVAGDSGGWQHTIPAFTAPELAIDRASRRWALSGQDPVTGDMIIVAGATMRDSLTVTRQPYYESGRLFLHAFGDGSTLVSRMKSSGVPWVGLAMLGGSPMDLRLEHRVGEQRRPIGVLPGYADCGKAMQRNTVHCTVRQRARQSLWRIDADSSSMTLLGNLPPQYDLWSDLDGSIVAGGSRGSANVVLVDLAKRTAARFSADDAVSESQYIWGIATASGTTVVLLNDGDGTSKVRFYRTQ